MSPYIDPTRREEIAEGGFPRSAGELNYRFTKEIQKFLKLKGESYETYNAVVGALENCKLEFYRRIVAPYEDTKIKKNGDVY